jgi:hypothetical protein
VGQQYPAGHFCVLWQRGAIVSDDLFDLFKKQKHHGKHGYDGDHHGDNHGDNHGYNQSHGYNQGDEHSKRHNEHHNGYYPANQNGNKNGDYHNSGNYGYSQNSFAKYEKLISQVLSNPKIIVVLVVGALLLLILGVVIIIALLPVLSSALGVVGKTGIRGIVESLWLGTGK